MRLRQGVTDLPQKVNCPLGRERAMTFDQIFETQTGEQLHHVVERAVMGVTIVKDFDCIPVSQLSRRPYFPFKSR